MTASSSSPTRSSHQGAQNGQYCTQKCLLGLVEGGPLDASCPNMRDHGRKCHHIDRATVLVLLRQQLSEDLDTNCKPVGTPGSCGVLFQIRLKSHGYIVAAKCTPIDFVHRLRWEATIYERLRPIQGVHVPVHLGNIDLETPYFYDGIAELVHMMLLSFGGKLISQHVTSENRPYLTQEADCSAQAVHKLGVLHQDLMPRNMLWNEEIGRVMVIDFERAKFVQLRTVLGSIPANRKRKSPEDSVAKRGCDKPSVFARERQRMAVELRGLR
jgi:serine/threonine protein kinase